MIIKHTIKHTNNLNLLVVSKSWRMRRVKFHPRPLPPPAVSPRFTKAPVPNFSLKISCTPSLPLPSVWSDFETFPRHCLCCCFYFETKSVVFPLFPPLYTQLDDGDIYKKKEDDFKQAADIELLTSVISPILQSWLHWWCVSSSLPPLCAASVELPWQRAVSQNKVPYYIK